MTGLVNMRPVATLYRAKSLYENEIIQMVDDICSINVERCSPAHAHTHTHQIKICLNFQSDIQLYHIIHVCAIVLHLSINPL